MVVIGVTCPRIYLPTQQYFGTCIQWRAEGVIEKMRDVLHGRVRQQIKKKAKWTTLIIIDSQAVKNTLLCQFRVKRVLFLQSHKRNQKAFSSRYLGVSFFYPLHQSQCI